MVRGKEGDVFIFEYKRGQRLTLDNTVLALGFFDGVHTAHRMLIEDGMRIAKEQSLRFAVLTFPSEDRLKKSSPRIYGTEERLSLFNKMGVENVVLADFNSISDMSAEEFVNEALVRDMGCKIAVAGYNFRFGKGASGSSADLLKLMRAVGGDAIIHSEHSYQGKPISATRIRVALQSGDVRLANKLLSAPYFVKGAVTHGKSLGHTLGFPTVNMSLPEERFVIANGVYKTDVEIDGTIYKGITNVGSCPTFESRDIHLETFILDFEGNLYEREITVYFMDYLREERKFSSPEELTKQIAKDCELVKGDLYGRHLD